MLTELLVRLACGVFPSVQSRVNTMAIELLISARYALERASYYPTAPATRACYSTRDALRISLESILHSKAIPRTSKI